MMKKVGMQQNDINNILKDSELEDFDNSNFMLWKSRLQEELPSFWESMQDSKNGYNQDCIVSKSVKLS